MRTLTGGDQSRAAVTELAHGPRVLGGPLSAPSAGVTAAGRSLDPRRPDAVPRLADSSGVIAAGWTAGGARGWPAALARSRPAADAATYRPG